MIPALHSTLRSAAVLAAVALAAVAGGCGASDDPQTATTSATPTPSPRPVFTGEAARVAAAVRNFGVALQRGDVERICTPNAMMTAAAVGQLDQNGSCEQFADARIEGSGNIALAASSIRLRPDLAVANVRQPGGATVPVTLLKDRGRWLLSFSGVEDPITAVLG